MTHYQLNSTTFGKYLITTGYWKLQNIAILKSLLSTIVSSLVIGLFFWLLTLIKNGKAMGGGDVKLAFLIGLFNGFPQNILAIFLGFLSGAVISLFLIGIGKKTMKDIIPFGPFLILGSFIALFWGNVLIDFYFGLFN
jgi:leader peptidase (prepilin peptidase)/N-methyltransferase